MIVTWLILLRIMLALNIAAPALVAPVVRAPASSRAAAPSMDLAKDFFSDFSPDLTPNKPWTSSEISDKAGLEELANKLNPVFGYYDPLGIGDKSKELIGWFRHAEIKHGRVAMAAFVGFTVQSMGIHFPGNIQGMATYHGVTPLSYAEISAAGGPSDQWDALPSAAKCQILLAIGFLEVVGESSVFLEADGQQHYVRGGKPGYYPKLKGKMPHPVPLNLWDPFGFTGKMSPERKESALLAEINNGRWAMLGIFGCISSTKGLIVPGIDSLGLTPYAGEPMAPFAANNVDLPFVSQMLDLRAAQILREAAFLGGEATAAAAPVVEAAAAAAP